MAQLGEFEIQMHADLEPFKQGLERARKAVMELEAAIEALNVTPITISTGSKSEYKTMDIKNSAYESFAESCEDSE